MSNSTAASTSYSSSLESSAAASSSLASAISSSIASAVSSSVYSAQDSTTTVEPSTTNVVTSIISASAAPATTNILTSVVTQSAVSNGITDTNPVTVVITSVNSPSTTAVVAAGTTSHTSSTSSSASSTASALSTTGDAGGSGGSGGLSTAGKTAIAVVIPVVAVALLVLAGILLWRKRKQRRAESETRREEIENYGYNPNRDPALPPLGSDGGQPEMTQDSNSGYRGWGAATGSNRKASTTLSGGHTQGQLSESGNSYGHSPGSPGAAGSDGHSGDPLVHPRETMNSDDLGALAGPTAASNHPIRRGPSNASSAYSAGARSEGSDEPVPPVPTNYDLAPNNGYGYGQHGPYGDGSYGGGQQDGGMPIVRDVSARRNTRIQQGGGYGQGASGIAQNF